MKTENYLLTCLFNLLPGVNFENKKPTNSNNFLPLK